MDGCTWSLLPSWQRGHPALFSGLEPRLPLQSGSDRTHIFSSKTLHQCTQYFTLASSSAQTAGRESNPWMRTAIWERSPSPSLTPRVRSWNTGLRIKILILSSGFCKILISSRGFCKILISIKYRVSSWNTGLKISCHYGMQVDVVGQSIVGAIYQQQIFKVLSIKV